MRPVSLFVLGLFVIACVTRAQQPASGGGPAPPPARPIPGISADDAYPAGCVGCHVDMPDIGVDARLSTAMKRWAETVEPELLAMAQRTMPADATLKGKHPPAAKALEDIPAACIKCHATMSKKAPPLSRLLHVIHFTGGNDNHFMTLFQGECTYCHKPNLETGAWSIPSGPER